MRKFGRFLRNLILILLLVIGLVQFVLPREEAHRGPPFAGDVSDPDAYLAAREAAIPGITPGTEARVIWNGEQGQKTPISILYLHGYSATSEEIRPVPDMVAETLGANLVYARLRGHGRDGAALAAARAGQWIDDTAEALAIARQVGDRVLIMSTSTGGTLAAIAATEQDMSPGIAGIVFISPNFALANPAGMLLNWPYARHWVNYLVGPTRSFEPQNADHGRFWTHEYPTVALVSLGTLMAEANRRDYQGVTIPALFIFAEDDQVVSAAATHAFAERWGGPHEIHRQILPDEGADPNHHVIAGRILSPAMTDPVASDIENWVERVVMAAQ